MIESDLVEEKWDKRKIAIGITSLVLIIGAAIAGRTLLSNAGFISQNKTAVEGTQTGVNGNDSNSPQQQNVSLPKLSLPSAQDVSNQIQTIQDKVTHLSLQEVAQSSPQVQEVIKQIQALPQLPAKEAKKACVDLCSKL